MYFLRAADVDYIEAASNYVRLHTGKTGAPAPGVADQHREPAQPGPLSPHSPHDHRQRRAHSELQPWFSGEFVAILTDGTRLKVSRGYRDRVSRWLGQSL